MPGFNGTGPRGMGPMTGWGRGNCATDKSPQPETDKKEVTETGAAGTPAAPAGYYGLGRGGMPRGCGRGFGGGRGRGGNAAGGRGFGGGGRGRGRF